MSRQLLIFTNENYPGEFPEDELKKLNSGNTLHFASDEDEALDILNNNEVEIAVCSLDRKEEFYKIQSIRNNFPQVFIIAFSNEKNKTTLQTLYKYAHQLLSFPFESKKLANSFEQKAKMTKYLHDGQLIGLINNIGDLPILPDTYLEIEKEITSSNLSFHKISSIISRDLAFTAKVLHLVNSPFFGLRNKINDVLQAINILGVNILKSLLLFDNLSAKFKISPQFRKYFEDLWTHSNRVGKFAEQIIYLNANAEIKMMEDAYIAGLFHDIGKLVMLSIDDYPDVVFSYMEQNQTRYSTAEYKIYGTSHSEVGAYFLTLWGFPDRTAEAVFMHNNYSGMNFETFTVENTLFIANLLAVDENLLLEDLKTINPGVHPKDWIEYLDRNGLLKVKMS